MTEENKENCNFQQNYNVFGLDDKPCCYLYHKYCDEIDSCYFKRCKRLEQENKELKEKLDKEEYNACCECTNIQNQNDEYRSALEEINITVKQLLQGVSSNCINNTPYLTALSLIENKINEALQ